MVNLDELVPEGTELLVQNDPLPVYSYIDKTIDECADDVRRIAPLHYCSKISELPVISNCIVVPGGYIRFGWVKCSDWEKTALRLVDPNREPELYSIITNPTITKGKAKPYVAINRKVIEIDGQDTDANVIELYNTDETTASLSYVETENVESVDERLLNAICWLCATKVLIITGRKEAETANTQYTNEMNLLTA
jgi:hypothetical protein